MSSNLFGMEGLWSWSNGSILVFILAGLLFFFAIREVITWYWKINKIEKLLEKIEKNTRDGSKDAIGSVIDRPDSLEKSYSTLVLSLAAVIIAVILIVSVS